VQVRVDSSQLKKRLERIVGERNPFTSPRRLAEVESYIENELKSFGLAVESDPFRYRGKSYRNIIARGKAHSNATMIILGAHFDSVEQTPGADDNASGVAVLLEAARLLAGARLKHQLVFCAFNLEEQNMIGSTHLAKKLKQGGAKISAMISLEMVGFTDRRPGSQKYPPALSWFYPEQGDFIGVIGNWRSYSLLKRFTRLMRQTQRLSVESLTVLGNGFLIPAVRLSDHSPFWDAGYPALLVTDTSFFRNPHYHRPSDTIETLDLDFMVKVCEGVVTAVSNL
jgi:aminopeptidase YwaD